ncbi:MAG: arsenate reductase ArsC [Phycisphaeraceae bacterium]|nr:MAG: arsenate reductase ArsC [Phycisphaeraceae bacterium]
MSASPSRIRVLFLCTGNSCRSQMAEGWARALRADSIDACSAGTDPHGLNPLAVRVMQEAGVDISGHVSQAVDAFDLSTIDVVATVCDAAHEQCPVIPGLKGIRQVHRSFDDPPRLARDAASEEEALGHYRRVRDEIRAWVETMPGSLGVSDK